jgi:hypothetical protein
MQKTMEKDQDLTLMKARSYRSVLADGYRLYNENFRKLFKASWILAIVYALCCGAFGTLTAIKVPELTFALMQQLSSIQGFFAETAKTYALTIAGIIGLLLLAIAAMSMASATILNKLKEHKDTGTISTPPYWLTTSPAMMGRSLKGVFLTILVLIIPMLLFIGMVAITESVKPQALIGHLTTFIVALCIVCIIIVILVQPLMYVLMKYVMEAPCKYWKTLSANFGCGMRHWGSLFLVFFLSMLLVQLIGLVIMLPSHILSYANQQAHMGLLIGDPLGMPSYMSTLTFATFTLCSFIEFYVSQVMLVHNYYIYGSIDTKEQEREQQKQNIK